MCRTTTLLSRMADLARSVALRKVDDVLADVTSAAKQLIPGVDVAGVLLIGRAGSFETLAPTNDLMFKLDELQMRSGEGPCLKRRSTRSSCASDDFRDEPRTSRRTPRRS